MDGVAPCPCWLPERPPLVTRPLGKRLPEEPGYPLRAESPGEEPSDPGDLELVELAPSVKGLRSPRSAGSPPGERSHGSSGAASRGGSEGERPAQRSGDAADCADCAWGGGGRPPGDAVAATERNHEGTAPCAADRPVPADSGIVTADSCPPPPPPSSSPPPSPSLPPTSSLPAADCPLLESRTRSRHVVAPRRPAARRRLLRGVLPRSPAEPISPPASGRASAPSRSSPAPPLCGCPCGRACGCEKCTDGSSRIAWTFPLSGRRACGAPGPAAAPDGGVLGAWSDDSPRTAPSARRPSAPAPECSCGGRRDPPSSSDPSEKRAWNRNPGLKLGLLAGLRPGMCPGLADGGGVAKG